MTLEDLAIKVVEAAETTGVPFMAVGAYGVPRSTRDVDLLVAVNIGGGIEALIDKLSPLVEFSTQVLFDTLTWGRRHVGKSRSRPPFKVELFGIR